MTKDDLIQQTQKHLTGIKLWWTQLSAKMRMIIVAATAVAVILFLSISIGGSRTPRSIERVLRQDTITTIDVTTAAEVVTRMRAIDLKGCPNDFKAAYLTHIHAWEGMAQLEQEAAAFQASNTTGKVMLESFIRGALGDPWGKAREIEVGQSQLKTTYQACQAEVTSTFNHVQEIAVMHGAELPKRP